MDNNSTEIELDIPTLGYFIDRALCVMIRQLNKELRARKLNFQHSDFTIMKVLSVTNGLTQSELSKILGKEKSGISRSLASLEKNGYIVRKAVNGCTYNVSLSEKGLETIPVLKNIAEIVTDRAFTGFSPKKRKEMMDNLTKIYKNSI